MKKYHFNNMGLAVVAMVLVFTAQVSFSDLASASGLLADVAVMATQSSSALAAAANSGDVEAIAEAQKQVNAVDSAMAEAQEAYASMEREIAAGNIDAAASAEEDLVAAQQKASDALGGVFPQEGSQAGATGDQNQADAGGPGREDDPPNIYDTPWESDGLRSAKQGMFGVAWSASSQGGSSYGERDATPE